jgi:hypothetical protein
MNDFNMPILGILSDGKKIFFEFTPKSYGLPEDRCHDLQLENFRIEESLHIEGDLPNQQKA